MMWDLPTTVEIDGKKFAIRNKCDYRVILDIISVFNDEDLSKEEKIKCSLYIFFEDLTELTNIQSALNEMLKIINLGKKEDDSQTEKPRLMDWEHDFQQIAPPVSRVLGYDVRTPDRYCHFWTFLGAYMEIGECTFNNIVSIRSKKAKGKQLEKWEQEFYRENKNLVDLPQNLTEEEQNWLVSDW